jgi:hypothetical protein
LKKSLSLLAGVAVLAVAAVPAVGQSADKVTPTAVTRKTKPLTPHKYPWKLTTTGAVKKPRTNCPPGQGVKNNPYCTPELTDAQACRGKVRVTFTLGTKVVSKKSTKVKSNCTYKNTQTLTDKSLAGKRVRVQARFLGNASMNPRSSTRRRVLLARNSTGL